ncbi:hypothetical protein [Actinomadura sp. HBU206391]|uniref:hypothetical protein n=1 Tax=Actinomadura sp. HBU206391 TaxID=2731692 RepID=UPI00164F7FE3|nr:hypothetical protein [Actinomadura sp. HBU206391]MBC6458445.1 hypothetical protein [Actinomadura sp. HBU206391]
MSDFAELLTGVTVVSFGAVWFAREFAMVIGDVREMVRDWVTAYRSQHVDENRASREEDLLRDYFPGAGKVISRCVPEPLALGFPSGKPG